MIELRKPTTFEAMKAQTIEYLKEVHELYISKYDGKDFIIIDSHEQLEKIENYLTQYIDDFTDEYDLNMLQIEYGFDDEYTTCHNCNKIVCMTPNYYGDMLDYTLTNECELLCNDCIDIEDLIVELTNNPNKCLKSNLVTSNSLLQKGWILHNLDSYQSGLYRGMNGDPKKIVKTIDTAKYDYIFYLSSTSQFYIEFDLYIKLKGVEL